MQFIPHRKYSVPPLQRHFLYIQKIKSVCKMQTYSVNLKAGVAYINHSA
jgi:hypothetical protein